METGGRGAIAPQDFGRFRSNEMIFYYCPIPSNCQTFRCLSEIETRLKSRKFQVPILFFQALRSAALAAPAIEDFEKHEGTHILQSLDGFAIALNSDGRFLYISETVSIYLGLSQVRPLCIHNSWHIVYYVCSM